MLEEAGAETIGTVTATVKPATDAEFAQDVQALIRFGLVRRNETRSAGKEKIELVLTERDWKALTE
jgi:hypothetical protein